MAMATAGAIRRRHLPNMTLLGIAVGIAAAGGDGWREEYGRMLEGRMVLCIPAIDLPIMLAWVAFGLCVGPRFPHNALVWVLSMSPPWLWQ